MKTCAFIACNNPVFSKKHCLWHQYVVKKPTRRKHVKIKPVSKKLAKDQRKYSGLRVSFLEEYPDCQAKLEGCVQVATEVHHKAGRGIYLLIISTWMAICWKCHHIIHNEMSMDEAVEKGLRIKLV